MLVLSRRKDEGLTIGDDVEIVVVRVSGGTVQIGIRAPGTLKILRTELVQAEKQKAELAPLRKVAC